MPEQNQNNGNGNLTDEQLLAISDIDMQDTNKYCDEDRKRKDELLMKQRRERYDKNPEAFIELSEIICAVVRNPKSQLGVSVVIGNAKRSEIAIGQSELNHRIELVRRQMDIEAEAKKQNKIQPVKGSMFNFARRRK